MIRNYLKIAWRSFLKKSLFSFINVFGLALSLSVCMLVMIRMKDAFSYDRFHPHPDRTYRIISEIKNKKGDHWKMASTPLPLEQSLLQNNNVAEKIVRIYPAINEKTSTATKELNIRGAFTDPSFFDVFGFTLKQGNEKEALIQPNKIVLSSATAERFFGKKQAVGEILNLGNLGVFEVTGVLNNFPGKSHLDLDAYVSFSTIPQLEKLHKLPAMSQSWDSFEKGYTYVLLNKDASVNALQNSLQGVSTEVNKLSKDGQFNFITEPLSSITPGNSDVYNGLGSGTSWMKIYVEAAIALIILIAACFNYTNLTIARALTRAKEVGIRKVAGAVRRQIFTQYIIESVLVALFALVFAFILFMFMMRYKPFNDGYEMIPDVSLDLSLISVFIVFTVLTGCIAGALPAWILSSFKPVQVLKSISTKKLFGNISLQKGLVVFQFTLSLVIIIFLSAFYSQFSFIGKADYGFRKDNTLIIPLNGNKPEIIRNAISGINGVDNITAVSDNFGNRQTGDIPVLYNKDQNQRLNLAYYYTDENVVPVMDLTLKAGDNLPVTNNENKSKYMLINEKAVRAMGFRNPDDAVNKTVWLNDTLLATITGVISDFYYRNPGIDIRPMALINNPSEAKFLTLNVSATNKERLVEQIGAVWKDVTKQDNFKFSWFTKYLEEASDQSATISLLGYLAFIAVSIAALGLLGLVIYTVETRRKEISIRKILGASVKILMLYLSKGFIKLLLIAGAIAMPLGFILSKMFLQNFSLRVDFGLMSVIACFLFLLAIGLLTILSQTFKASSENPVKNLRTE